MKHLFDSAPARLSTVPLIVALLIVSPILAQTLSLDPTFGVDGRVTTPIESFTSETVTALATDDLDRIYTGYSGLSGGVSRHDREGLLDPAFGAAGIVTLDFPVSDMVVQADGSIVAVGSRRSGLGSETQDWRVVRLLPDGTPDLTFGTDGFLDVDFQGQNDAAQTVAIDGNGRIVIGGRAFVPGLGSAMALAIVEANGSLRRQRTVKFFEGTADICMALIIQDDGKIVCAGLARNFGSAVMAAMRLDNELELDPSFGTDGLAVVTFPEGPAEANAALLQTNGSIVLGGFVEASDFDRNLALARLTSAGELDTTFGTEGRVELAVGDDDTETIEDLLVFQGDLYAAVAAAQSSAVPGSVVLARFDLDGAADLAFGNAGIASAQFVGDEDLARALTIHEGALLVGGAAGSQSVSEGTNIGLVRFTNSGTLDSSFSDDGLSDTSLRGPVNAQGQAIVHQPDGMVVLAGFVGVSFSDRNFVLSRYQQDGSLDETFGNLGIVVTDFADGEDAAFALAIQPDGKLLAAGSVRVPPATANDFGIARYLPDGTLDQTFGDSGRVILDIDGNTDAARDIVVQADGHILVAGTAQFPSLNFDRNLVVARLQANGAVDPSFGNNGVANVSVGNTDEGYALAVQGDGAIIVGGIGDRDFAVARFTSGGDLDTVFGEQGVATFDFAGEFDFLRDLLVIPDWNGTGERILAVGSTRDGSSVTRTMFAAVMFMTDGSLETSFGNAGAVTVDVSPDQSESAAAVASRGDGFVLVGEAVIDSQNRFTAVGLTVNGELDSSFSSAGAVLTINSVGGAIQQTNDRAQAVSVGSTGAVVLAGEAFNPLVASGGSRFAVARLAVSDVLFRDSFEVEGGAP
ncbi:MAG: hypothetical protein AB8B96_14745 [Lysobacterales bacterium]